MDLSGKVTSQLPEVSGSSKSGNSWRKQEYIIETGGQYPKKVCVSIWGDKINEQQLVIGNNLTIDFDVESREYSGRWYTDVKAWKIEVASQTNPPTNNLDNIEPLDLSQEDDEGLPF